MKAEIGSRIRKLRCAVNLSQDQLAEMLDISTGYLGLVERGQRCLGLVNLVKLMSVFRVTLDYLVIGYNGEAAHGRQKLNETADNLGNNGEFVVLADAIRDIAQYNVSAGEIDLLSQALRFHLNMMMQTRAMYKGSA